MARRHKRSPDPARSSGSVVRATVYVLLVVTSTVVAALGGHQIGKRSGPSQAAAAAASSAATQEAVARAVARQKAKDRALRVAALRDLANFQRQKFALEMSRRIADVRLAEAQNAARAYRRGKSAGAAAAEAAAERALAKADAQEGDEEDEDTAEAEAAEAEEPEGDAR